MINLEQALIRLHDDLGWKRLSAGWAKAEILFGLLAVGIGLGVMAGCVVPPSLSLPDWPRTVGGVALFALGGYLALAGHRSHLYQSNTLLAAYLLTQGRQRSEQAKGQDDAP